MLIVIIVVIMEGDDSDSEIVMMKFWSVIMKAIPEVVVMVMQIIMVVMGYDSGDKWWRRGYNGKVFVGDHRSDAQRLWWRCDNAIDK